jgi:hypothetical protein
LFGKLTAFTVRRIPIAVLQHVLSRIALALGVQIHPACALEEFNQADATFTIDSKYECPSRSQIERVDFDAIFDGTGTAGVVRDSVGGNNQALIETKNSGKEMLGLTMNFNRFASGENAFHERTKNDPRFKEHNPAYDSESNLGEQFARQLFLEKNVRIENWVYWKSDTSHYIVITIPRQTLIDKGLAPAPVGDRFVPTDVFLKSIDREKLPSLGLEIANEWNFPHESEDASAFVVNAVGKPDLSIFDFGKQTQAEIPCQILPGKRHRKPVYVGLIGDAIKTPFWPYGTGANHAFYSSNLQTWALLAWKGYNYGEEETVEFATKMMKQMLSMNTEGNDINFKKKDYDDMIEKNYLAVAKKNRMIFH